MTDLLADALTKLDAYEVHLDSPQGGLSSAKPWDDFAQAAAQFVRSCWHGRAP